MSAYSRLDRLGYQGKHYQAGEPRPLLKLRRIKVAWGLLIFLSALFSLLTVANPFLSSWADTLQSQGLYAGQAMALGQVPYNDFYGSSGLLYYLFNAIGVFGGNSIPLMLIHFIVLVLAGATFSKISYYLTGSEQASRNLLLAFFLSLGILAWGGVYAPLYALPFVLKGLWFLLRYFEGQASDEGFILYGLNGALTFLIDPKSTLLWLVAGFILLVIHVKEKQKARAVYQFLASLFGFLLALYGVGYYTIFYQNIGSAIQQTFLVPMQSLGRFQPTFSWQWALYPVFLLGTGLLTSIVYGFISLTKPGRFRTKLLLFLGFLVSLILALLNPYFSASHLLLTLPYGLGLTALFMVDSVMVVNDEADKLEELEEQDATEESAQAQNRELPSYWRLNAYLPILAVVYLFAYPAWIWYSQKEIHEERQKLVQEVTKNTEKSDRIYAWDQDASIYLLSQRQSAARIISPASYQVIQDQKEELQLDLGYDRAKYVIVNQNQALPDKVQQELDKKYEEIALNLEYFKLYQLK